MSLLQRGKLNIGFIDGQWGSSGKGKFNGTLAERERIDFAISHNSVNASHIWVDSSGESYKFQHLPTSVVSMHPKIVLGAGASICLPQLLNEIEDWGLDPHRLFIHPGAVVITDKDIEYEQKELCRIASTMTGNGAALARKVMRAPGVVLARDCEDLIPFLADTCELIHEWLKEGQTGVLETAQGFDLSIDHGMVYVAMSESGAYVHQAYPYCTSRNVDPLSFAGMTGVAHGMIGNVLLNLRTFPIRVGDGSNNKVDGLSGKDLSKAYSGDHYPDQCELSWDEITTCSGSPTPIMEMTSLTKRVRRVFSFSTQQLRHITRTVQPHFISINFVNYLDHRIAGREGVTTREWLEVDYPRVATFVRRVERDQYWAGTPLAGKVVWLGTGPKSDDLIILKD
jgi:adenylosuccinate synthase